ncbi:hypothetical protein RHSIM_Rhsim01G0054800 [Rhododendron simsii]|uniref:F-box associated beta-propeller type 3 domain-containing protein n=1 Tax=Rhododendron simsii TaxID=118357 RepID=A0A834HES3_RHOSS|nr:hypothetical protein RHSIM_Rhsim01G0054800 [Rhododendron simsii]
MHLGSIDGYDAEEALSSGDPLLPKPMVFTYKNIEVSTDSMQILGSCNGLLLVSHFMDLYLWNPTTRQCTKVLSIETHGPSKEYRFEIAKSGLWYDSYSDDYKAILVDNYGSVNIVSFRRKIWKNTICSFVDDTDRLVYGLVVNGKLHWLVTRFTNFRSPTLNRIVYFDPLTEEFVELPMPLVPNNGNHNSTILGLGVLEGCLCMARRVSGRGDEVEPRYVDDEFEPDPSFIEVLVMKEHGEGGSWSSVFVMPDKTQTSHWGRGRRPYIVHGMLVPLCCTTNGEVLFSVNENQLLVYHPGKMSQRYVLIKCNHWIDYEASYEESLASPAAYGHEEVWTVEGPDALKLLRYIWESWSSDDYNWEGEILNSTEEDSSIKEVDGSREEDDDCVSKGCSKKKDDQRKFSRREEARRKEIKHKTRQKIRDKRKSRCIRKNERKKKHGKDLEVEDLYKQVLDFSVK